MMHSIEYQQPTVKNANTVLQWFLVNEVDEIGQSNSVEFQKLYFRCSDQTRVSANRQGHKPIHATAGKPEPQSATVLS